jgi:hypothetical protein
MAEKKIKGVRRHKIRFIMGASTGVWAYRLWAHWSKRCCYIHNGGFCNGCITKRSLETYQMCHVSRLH